MDFAKFKKFFLYCLIGSLIVSALVAVVTVLIGTFNEITGRVISTLIMVVLHSLVSLMFIWDDEKQNTFDRLSFFINVMFGVISLSFLTSILGVWKILPGDLIPKFYSTYAIVAVAGLHTDFLSKILHKKSYLDYLVSANYLFIAIVFLMLQPAIYLSNSYEVLGEIYFRILAAAAIIDGTLSILAIIFYRLYLHDHPEESMLLTNSVSSNEPTQKKGISSWLWFLIIYLAFQVIGPMFYYGAMILQKTR